MILAQNGDEIILSLANVEIDSVSYGNSSKGWLELFAGISFSLDPAQFSAVGNNAAGNWCYTPAKFATPGGDVGTPGQLNPSCTGTPAVISVSPANGIDNGGDILTISGSGFTGVTAVSIGNNPCSNMTVIDDHTILCTTPAGNAGDVDVLAQKGGKSGTLKDGFRYTGEAVKTIDWCNIQWPAKIVVKANASSPLIYGQVHAPGVTPSDGKTSEILAQVGYGPHSSDPRNSPGWKWQTGIWHKQFFKNDEYKQTLSSGQVGTYSYAWRFSDDGGTHFMYCDNDPGTADGFQVQKLGILTVF